MLQLVAAALAVSLAACGGNGPPQAPPLEGARIGGSFTLTDQDGKTVTDADFAGRWRIVYFGYTYCPDVCPTDMAKIGQAMKLLEKQARATAAKVVPLFITVDPERDTPAVLKAFLANFHPRAVGLTGSPETIARVAKNYAVHIQKEPPAPGGGYLVGHTQIAYLMDPQGKPVTTLPLEQDAAAIARELRHWVR